MKKQKKKDRNGKDNPEQDWEHIAVKPKNKKRFVFLMAYLVTREKPKVTQDELLEDMMDTYEKHKSPNLFAKKKK